MNKLKRVSEFIIFAGTMYLFAYCVYIFGDKPVAEMNYRDLAVFIVLIKSLFSKKDL